VKEKGKKKGGWKLNKAPEDQEVLKAEKRMRRSTFNKLVSSSRPMINKKKMSPKLAMIERALMEEGGKKMFK
jgi:hypothetical protein